MPLATPPVVTDMTDLFAGFADFSQEELQGFIDEAESQISESYFGGLYNQAWLLAAAHEAAMEYRIKQNGTDLSATGLFVDKKKAGDMWIEFNSETMKGTPPYYATTIFGLKLWNLIRKRHFRGSFLTI